MSRDRTLYQETTITTDINGNIKEEIARKLIRTTPEDDYIKIYVRFIGAIANLPPTANPILNCLLRRMSYATSNQEVVINSRLIDLICKEIGISIANYYKQFRMLVNHGILFSEESVKSNNTKYRFCDIFYFNPYIFGKGSWQDIKEIRASITLNEEGMNLITEKSDTIDNSLPMPTNQQTLLGINWEEFNRREIQLRNVDYDN